MKTKFKALLSYLHGNMLTYTLALLAMVPSILLSFAVPLVLQITIDSVLGDKDPGNGWFARYFFRLTGDVSYLQHNLWLPGLIMVALAGLSGWFGYLRGRWSATAAENIAKNLRERLYDHIQHLPFKWHGTVQTGDIIQRCTSDVETIRRFLASQVVEIGRVVFMLILLIPIMWSLNHALTLVSMVGLPFIVAFSYIFTKRISRSFLASDEAEGALSSVLQENLSGMRVVQAFCRQPYEQDRFEVVNRDYLNKTFGLIRNLAWFWSWSDLLAVIQMWVSAMAGVLWAINGELTVGTLFAFITYEGRLIWPVRQLGRILSEMGKTMVSVGRVEEILAAPVEPVTGEEVGKLEGRVEFNRVGFAYEENRPILHDVSFTINPGETVAILGPTGSGKSTLVNLLPRLYDPTGGQILIGGHDIMTMKLNDLRKNVAIVLQEPFLFGKSIADNLAMGQAEATSTQLEEAARLACVHDVILGFEEGYQTMLGERGVTLSGGQRQRLAMARTLLRQAPVLIFDDSLSAVDTQTDARIRSALKSRRGKATTIIIAHRLTTLAEADRIIVLENGRITQQGTHTELLATEGLYRRIWNIQTDWENEVNQGDEPQPAVPAATEPVMAG